MSKVPRDEICPVCGGACQLCSNPDWDGDNCPEGRDGCDGECKSIIDCTYCKGEGMVTFAKMERYVRKISNIKWGVKKEMAKG
jgi:hypothetical protein